MFNGKLGDLQPVVIPTKADSGLLYDLLICAINQLHHTPLTLAIFVIADPSVSVPRWGIIFFMTSSVSLPVACCYVQQAGNTMYLIKMQLQTRTFLLGSALKQCLLDPTAFLKKLSQLGDEKNST